MTKYILVGGYPHKAEDAGRAFCEEVVRGFEGPVQILDCLFARPEENWEKAFAQDTAFFNKNLPGLQVEIELARPETFIEQITVANAIYIRGGATRTLIQILQGIDS